VPRKTKQNLIVRNYKSEDKVTNGKRLRLRYCTVEANYRQTRSIAQPLCDNTASTGIDKLTDIIDLIEKKFMKYVNCYTKVGLKISQ